MRALEFAGIGIIVLAPAAVSTPDFAVPMANVQTHRPSGYEASVSGNVVARTSAVTAEPLDRALADVFTAADMARLDAIERFEATRDDFDYDALLDYDDE